MSEARKASRALQRRFESTTKRKECIFARVVVIDVQVALAPYAQTPASVLGERVDHVVEEADAGVDVDFLRVGLLRGVVFVDFLALAVEVLLIKGSPEVAMFVGGEFAAIEVERDLDLGLIGVAVKGAGARHGGG